MKIAISSDHAGFLYKGKIISFLRTEGHAVEDMGTYSPESVDYPEWIRPVAEAVAAGERENYEVADADGIGAEGQKACGEGGVGGAG